MSTKLDDPLYPKRDCRCGGTWVSIAMLSCELRHFNFTGFACDKCTKRTFTLRVRNK